MTAPSLLDELEGVVRLSEDATPGEWFVATHGQPENHWRVADCGGSKSSLPNQLVVAEIGDYCKAAEDDAAYIAALSNFIRTHHAEIANMAKRLEAAERDAARYRKLRELTKHAWTVSEYARRGGVLQYTGIEIDAAIDAATQEGEG